MRKGLRATPVCSAWLLTNSSGLPYSTLAFIHEQPRPPTSAELAQAWGPYLLTCIDIFGPQRCMLESNFPVDKGSCSYQVLWSTFKRITANFSATEKQALYHDTAAGFYRV